MLNSAIYFAPSQLPNDVLLVLLALFSKLLHIYTFNCIWDCPKTFSQEFFKCSFFTHKHLRIHVINTLNQKDALRQIFTGNTLYFAYN